MGLVKRSQFAVSAYEFNVFWSLPRRQTPRDDQLTVGYHTTVSPCVGWYSGYLATLQLYKILLLAFFSRGRKL